MRHYAFAMYSSEGKDRWYHIVRPPYIGSENDTDISVMKVAMQAVYRANSIIDLDNKKYLKCRVLPADMMEVDEDWVDIMMDWPVTNLQDFYRENDIRTFSMR